MIILPEFSGFDWDKGNIDKNLSKHGVTIQEAEEVFSNKPLIVRRDVLHSSKELRFQALGKTKTGRKFFIAFTLRSGKVRAISVRDMTFNEEKAYEKAKGNS